MDSVFPITTSPSTLSLGDPSREPARPADMHRRAWLESRRLWVGASDVPALFGACPYRTPLHVYASKVLPVTEADLGDEMAVDDPRRLGLLMKPVLAQLYTLKTGIPLREVPFKTVRRGGGSLLACSPDRLATEGDITFPVQLKTAQEYHGWGPDGSQQIPPNYWIQVQAEMLVLNAPWADVAVLIRGQSFRTYRIPFNPVAQLEIEEMASDFWRKHVAVQVPPEPVWYHKDTVDLLNRLLPPTDTTTLILDDAESVDLVKQYHTAHKMQTEGEFDKREAKARLLMRMGNHTRAVLPDGSSITRTVSPRKGYTVPPGERITMCVNPPKGAWAANPAGGAGGEFEELNGEVA